MTEQPLSEKMKVIHSDYIGFCATQEDVKQSIQEFLKELKESIRDTMYFPDERSLYILNEIDTLAKQKFGDKLLK